MSHAHSTTKRRTFKHLNAYQRGQIEAMLRLGVPKVKIAKDLGIARSTLYEEIKRGTVTSFLDEFTATPPNYKLLSRTIPNRAVVSAIDDPIVPHEFSRSFAERFDAVFYETKTGRHYLDVDGVTTLPIVADVLSRMME